MDHWKQLSQDSQGYSPAPSDLRPEPRVIMRHTEKQEQAASRPLPTIPVTLKLHNVDVGVALRSLAAAAGVNVMLSPGVSGTVSLNVQKSPWRDVFQGLLRANGLQYRWQGNILQVLTAVEKQKEINLQTLDNQLAQQELISRQNSPLTVSVVSVRYAEAAALQQSLTKFLTAANGQGGQAAVIEVDEHSNALIIQATEQDQQRIIRLVDNLDRPRPQVHLKAYIVEATKETARELGVQWGGVWRSGSFNNGNHAWIGSGASGTQGQDPVTGGLTGTHGSASAARLSASTIPASPPTTWAPSASCSARSAAVCSKSSSTSWKRTATSTSCPRPPSPRWTTRWPTPRTAKRSPMFPQATWATARSSSKTRSCASR